MSRQKQFRQYFTPPAIAQAMVELVRPYLPSDPLVADLACGEGILLSTVLEWGLTTPDRIWGIDIDPQMKAIWNEIDVLQGCHLSIQDGLTFDLKGAGLGGQGFDLAIGNPPFNRAQNLITDSELLKRFKLGHRPLPPAEESLLDVRQLGFDFAGQGSTILGPVSDRVETMVSQPIEALFLERFVQVTRPGGYVVIILPEGLLSNDGSQDVRDFLMEQTDFLAIIGLPRRVFDNDAKTGILLLRKKQELGLRQREPVFLATVSKAVRHGDTTELCEVIRCFLAGPDGDSDTLLPIMYTWKPLKEIRHRMDPAYWDPIYDVPIQEMRQSGWKIKTLGDVLEKKRVISSDHVRASRGEAIGEQFEPEYYTVAGILSTGYDTTQLMYCSDNAYQRLKRTQLRHRDLIMANSGKGSVGKACVVHKPAKRSCVGDLFVLRVVDANPYWIAAFLKSDYGQAQIERIEHGVSRMTHLRTEDVQGLLVPLVDRSIQSQVERRYRQMSEFHEAAMKARATGNEAEYKEKLACAEQRLSELIAFVENVVERGPQVQTHPCSHGNLRGRAQWGRIHLTSPRRCSLPHYSVYLETAADGRCMAHLLDLPGCIVRAPSRDEALSRVPEAIREALAWLRRHGEPTPAAASEDAIEFQVAGESTGFGPFDRRSAAALFPPDREPVTPEEMERVFRFMGYTRADLLALVQDLPDDVLDWQPDPETFSVRRLLRHVGNAEEWYVSRIVDADTLPPQWDQDEDLPILEFLEMERRTAVARLRQLTEAERTDVFYPTGWTDHPEEPWTVRKALRRFLEHEREHTAQAREILSAWRAHQLAHLAAERAGLLWQAVALDEGTLTRSPVFDDWTAKDLLAHVAAWDEMFAGCIELVLAGREDEIEGVDLDADNARYHAERAGWSVAQAVEACVTARDDFLAAAARLPDEEFYRLRTVPWGETSVCQWTQWRAWHDAAHAGELAAWREERDLARVCGPKPVLAAALDAARQELLAAAVLVPPEERASRPVCGVWTTKDVLGHIVDWEWIGVGGLRQMAAGQAPLVEHIADIEAWNQAHYEARRDQSWEEVWVDLHAARAELLEVLDGMSQAALSKSHPFPWGPEGTAHQWVSVFIQHDRGHARDLRE